MGLIWALSALDRVTLGFKTLKKPSQGFSSGDALDFSADRSKMPDVHFQNGQSPANNAQTHQEGKS